MALEFEDGVAVYEIEHTMNLIGMQPTADVVPKSEVEATVEKLMSATDKVICEAKAEVAREIFAEIEKIIEASEYEVFDDFGDTIAKCHNAQMIIDDFAELKKKYTEEKHEN